MKRYLAALLVAGCIESVQPDVGPLLGPVCDNTDSDPSTAVSYATDIAARILDGSGHCTTCHSPTAPNPIGFQATGFDVSSYASLRRGGITSGATIVVDGDACTSILLLKVSASPPFGSRMPYNGPPYLSDEDQQLIHDWIAEGAPDN